MGVDLNWGLLQSPNFLNIALTGARAGKQWRDEQAADEAMEAYRNNPDDPAALRSALLYNPGSAMAIGQAEALNRQRATDAAVQPFVAKKDWQGAAEVAAVNRDYDAAFALGRLSDAELARNRAAGAQGAAALYAGSNIPDIDQRRAYMQLHRSDAIAAGIPASVFDRMTWDPQDMRARAAGNMSLHDQAMLEMQRRALDARSQRYDLTQQSQGPAQAGSSYGGAGGSKSGADIESILGKVTSGQSLSDAETSNLRDYVDSVRAESSPSDGVYDSPIQPTSLDDFEQLPVGGWFINPADGQKMRKTY